MSTDPKPAEPTPDPFFAALKRYWPYFVHVVAIVGWGIVAYQAYKGGQPIPPPPVIVDNAGPGVAAGGPEPPAFHATGWHRDDEAVKAVAAEMRFPVFAATPAGQAADPLPKAVYLWEAHRKLTGQLPPVMDQNPIGSCVSFGTSRANERSLAVAIANGAPFEFKHLVEEAVYGGSRNEARPPGAQRIRGDGSVGAWAARWVTQYGALPRGVYGQHDLTKYDPNRCRAWGNTGVPNELEPEVKKFRVGSATQVRDWSEAKRALANGYGMAICSDVGFNKPGTRPGYVDPATRDARGVCQPYGQWGHCMCLDGYHTDESGKEYGHIENSWGPNAHRGPVGWGTPNTSGFWAEAAVIDRMIRTGGDTWAFSAVTGFPRQDIDWFVNAVPNRRQLDADRPVLALAH